MLQTFDLYVVYYNTFVKHHSGGFVGPFCPIYYKTLIKSQQSTVCLYINTAHSTVMYLGNVRSLKMMLGVIYSVRQCLS